MSLGYTYSPTSDATPAGTAVPAERARRAGEASGEKMARATGFWRRLEVRECEAERTRREARSSAPPKRVVKKRS